MDVEVRIDPAGDASCQIGHCHPFVGLGWGDTAPAGRRTGQRRACVRQAPIRSLRPTDGCRVGDRARPTDRTQDSPKGTSAGLLESDLAWAPTHTLTNPFTEVVDHPAATSILAAGRGTAIHAVFPCPWGIRDRVFP